MHGHKSTYLTKERNIPQNKTGKTNLGSYQQKKKLNIIILCKDKKLITPHEYNDNMLRIRFKDNDNFSSECVVDGANDPCMVYTSIAVY